jgi:gamma-glutamyltranspeptidase / glutathione hydrolase
MSHAFLTALLALTGVVFVGALVAGREQPAARPVPGRSMVATTYGIVATSQPLAARAGAQVLERGGHAVDAAIATNAVMGVLEPTGNGIGGDLFAIVYDAKTRTLAGLNASGPAPMGLSVASLRARGITSMPARGIDAVTVPGTVAGWAAMHDRFARLSLADLVAPAVHYAEQGAAIPEITASLWNRSEKLLAEHPNSRRTFLIEGRAPRAGEVFRNPDLAATLRRIGEHGQAGFYRGTTAEAILAISRETGGTFAADDLSRFQAEWVTPIETTYRGWRVAQLPPNGQGIAALMMLDLMERFPIAEHGFHSTEALHVMIEAKKLAYADMLRYVGDPAFSTIDVPALLARSRAGARARTIDPARANCDPQPDTLDGITTAEGHDTILLTVVDREGNMVTLIQSNYQGFGSGLVPSGQGFMLHNRGALFTLEPNRPNTLEPGKRPLHTIIPAFMERGDERIAFGIMGGWNQAQAHAQFVSHVADFGFSIQEALEAGRFTKDTFTGCDVQIEELVPAGTREALAKLGHDVTVRPRRTSTFGYGQAVMRRADGVNLGASDPRHDGAAIPEAPPVFGTTPSGSPR